MYIDHETIVTAASVLTALVVIFSAVFAIYRWYLKQGKQDEEIAQMKQEQALLTYGILACLWPGPPSCEMENQRFSNYAPWVLQGFFKHFSSNVLK